MFRRTFCIHTIKIVYQIRCKGVNLQLKLFLLLNLLTINNLIINNKDIIYVAKYNVIEYNS